MISEAQDAAIYREELRARRRERLAALVMLWGPAIVDQYATRRRRDGVVCHERKREEEWTVWRAVLATIAIILNRTHGQKQVERHRQRTGKLYIPSFDLGFWDSRADGYGYSVMILQLYAWARVEIISDGESLM